MLGAGRYARGKVAMMRHWPGGAPGMPGLGPAIRMTSVAVVWIGSQGRTDSAAERKA